MLRRVNAELQLIRLAAQGTISAPQVVGTFGLGPLVANLGSQLVVAWDAPNLHLKSFAP